ncbi:MAG: DNA damage-inducible protein D [Acidobacteriales bacterium]|nr:DNA damage-inducible protein D [Terriglobales bacterium]
MKQDSPKSKQLAEMAFSSAFKARGAQVSSGKSTASEDGSIIQLIEKFEQASHVDEDGIEYWFARDLQKLLGYVEYRNFQPVIAKAMEACRNSGQPIENHFVQVHEMVEIGSNAERRVSDYKLTRYASYLIAQNGDSRKAPIAFAQTYFAIQSRRQEISNSEAQQYAPLSEDHKRLLLRDEIKAHNKNLASAAKGAGVATPIDFAIFQNFGYKGLYGGLDKNGIQKKKRLTSRENILDHMGSTELAANLFRATQAEEKLRRENVTGKNRANHVHLDVGKRVRQTIRELGGTMPENLPTAENIEKVAKRLKNAASGKLQRSSEDES